MSVKHHDVVRVAVGLVEGGPQRTGWRGAHRISDIILGDDWTEAAAKRGTNLDQTALARWSDECQLIVCLSFSLTEDLP